MIKTGVNTSFKMLMLMSNKRQTWMMMRMMMIWKIHKRGDHRHRYDGELIVGGEAAATMTMGKRKEGILIMLMLVTTTMMIAMLLLMMMMMMLMIPIYPSNTSHKRKTKPSWTLHPPLPCILTHHRLHQRLLLRQRWHP